MRATSYLASAIIIAACGGTTDTTTIPNPDGSAGNDGQSQSDGSSNNDAGNNNDGGNGQDGGGDNDAGGNCTPPDMPCSQPCPTGTVCLTSSGPVVHQLGCTPIPPACTNGVATCDCMAACFCPKSGMNKCVAGNGGLTCNSGAVSRREFKKDITYVGDAEREELASEALSIPLATYRYKTEPDKDKKHLGFIIDDQPDPSPAVQSDRTHVDEYGYTSMLLATVQQQQKQIDALTRKVDVLEKQCK